MEPYVPRPQRGPSVRAGLFRKDEFKYDPETDSFTCPAGQRLTPYLVVCLAATEEDQLQQPQGVPGLSSSGPLH